MELIWCLRPCQKAIAVTRGWSFEGKCFRFVLTVPIICQSFWQSLWAVRGRDTFLLCQTLRLLYASLRISLYHEDCGGSVCDFLDLQACIHDWLHVVISQLYGSSRGLNFPSSLFICCTTMQSQSHDVTSGLSSAPVAFASQWNSFINLSSWEPWSWNFSLIL